MISDLTPRQERFALKYHETSSAVKAYRHAYNAGKTTLASCKELARRVRNHPKVQRRITQLQEEDREENKITVKQIVEELEAARILAMKEGQTSAAVAASMGKAKLFGLIVDKHKTQTESTNVNYNQELPMTESDKEILKRLGWKEEPST